MDINWLKKFRLDFLVNESKMLSIILLALFWVVGLHVRIPYCFELLVPSTCEHYLHLLVLRSHPSSITVLLYPLVCCMLNLLIVFLFCFNLAYHIHNHNSHPEHFFKLFIFGCTRELWWQLSSTAAPLGSIANSLLTPDAPRSTREQSMEKSYAIPGSNVRIPRSTSWCSTSLGSTFWPSW